VQPEPAKETNKLLAANADGMAGENVIAEMMSRSFMKPSV